MKRGIFYIVLLFPMFLTAQAPKWEKIYGSLNWNEEPTAIHEMYDGGIFVTAYSEILGNGEWTFKISVNGDVLYEKDLLHNNYAVLSGAIESDSSGNLYIGGTFFPQGDFLPFVIKLDSCGELIWCKHFALVPNSSGGFVGDLLLNHNHELMVLMSYSTGNQGDQIYLGCLDENGNELWFDSYARKEDYPLLVNPIAWDLLEHNHEYYIAGYGYYPFPDDPTHVYLRPLFIGVDSNFQEKFMTPFYAQDSIFGWIEKLIPISDSIIMGGGIVKKDGGQDHSLLAFINNSGLEKGYNEILNSDIGPNIKDNMLNDIQRINDTLLFAAWKYGENTGSNPAGELVFDTAANIYSFSSHPNTIANPRLVKTIGNNFIIATSINTNGNTNISLYKIDENLNSVPFDTTHHTYDSLCPHTIQSGEMDLTDCLVITGIEDWPTPAQYYESIRWIPIKAYPNPVTEGNLTLEFENTKHHKNMELHCYDDFGRQIHHQKIYKGQQDTDVDVSGWPPGIYIAVVYSDGSARGKVKFVVR